MTQSFRSPAKVIRRLKLAPLISRKLSNWPSFLYNYAIGTVPNSAYTFRNGALVKIGRGVDHVPIIEIFLRQEYGLIPNGSVILDLGANIGTFAIYAATTARDVTVYAYEPEPAFFKLLQENVRLNGLEGSIKCFNVAVGGERADRELFQSNIDFFFPTLVPPRNMATVTNTVVQCLPLADVLEANGLSQVDLLKMDTEGAEYETLYNTPAVELRRIAQIRMEYHNLDSDQRNVNALKRFLVANGFDITHELVNSPTNGQLWAQRP